MGCVVCPTARPSHEQSKEKRAQASRYFRESRRKQKALLFYALSPIRLALSALTLSPAFLHTVKQVGGAALAAATA
jgi:hypothetical protein